MRATATSAAATAAKKPDREGIIAVLQDQATFEARFASCSSKTS